MNKNETFTATATANAALRATGATPIAAVKAARKAGITTGLLVTETATGTPVMQTAAEWTGDTIWTAETRSN